MNSLKDLKKFSDTLKESRDKMPVLFIGHGSPMNGIEDNEFSQRWKQMGKDILHQQRFFVFPPIGLREAR